MFSFFKRLLSGGTAPCWARLLRCGGAARSSSAKMNRATNITKRAASRVFSDGRRRRWVVYHGVAEGSRVTPDWHGWLHHTFDEPPTTQPFREEKVRKTLFAEYDRHTARLSAKRIFGAGVR